MNFLAVICLIAVAINGCAAAPATLPMSTAPACASDDLMTQASKCIRDSGLATVYIRMMSNLSTVDDLKDQCVHPEPYEMAAKCIADKYKRCFPDDDMFPLGSVDQMFQYSRALCNDPKADFDCLAQLYRRQSEITACVASQISGINFTTKTNKQIMCVSMKAGIPCSGSVIRKCDDYTATLIENQMRQLTPLECFFFGEG